MTVQESAPAVLMAYLNGSAGETMAAAVEEAGFRAVACASTDELMQIFQREQPQCLVMAHDPNGPDSAALLHALKTDTIYGHVPVMLILPYPPPADLDWTALPADDYLVQPVDPQELTLRIKLSLARNHRDVNANPLTGLPGNLTIMKEAEHRLSAGIPFALGYFDLDNFKAYNDIYGFSRGDEVLRMTARLLVNTVRSFGCPDMYVGQIGGDDFIFMTPPDHIGGVCESIVRNFDQIVLSFYDDADRKRGYLTAPNRQGDIETYSLMNCSIGVVVTDGESIKHIADLSTRAAQVKSRAKRQKGSTYFVDRRQ